MNAAMLTAALKEEATRLGFDLSGTTPAIAPPGFDRFRQWLADGFAGDMHYLTDGFAGDMHYLADRLDAYADPGRLLDGAKSILMLGVNYRTIEPVAAQPGQGRVSRYAWGADYHEVIRQRLHALADFYHRLVPHGRVRGVVDTAPLLERQFAQRAGLGWIGKSTMLINERFGSWIFLAALLTTEELEYDEPAMTGRCGSCRACLDACPTGALVEPYRLDARKCVSYLTIESRGPIPAELRAACGDRLFGCDACQAACPHNGRTSATAEPAFHPSPGMNPAELAELLALDEEAFRRRFCHTPLWRARREGIVRNAGVVLENQARIS